MKNLSYKYRFLFYLISILYIITGGIGIVHPVLFATYAILLLGGFFMINGWSNLIDGIINLRHREYHWGMSLFLGFIEILMALSIFSRPLASEIYLVVYIGAILLVRGIFIIFSSFGARDDLKSPYLSMGVISTIFGFLFMGTPLFTEKLIVMVVAWFIIFSGIDLFIATLSLRHQPKDI